LSINGATGAFPRSFALPAAPVFLARSRPVDAGRPAGKLLDLRISFGLKWRDVSFASKHRATLRPTRSVRNAIGGARLIHISPAEAEITAQAWDTAFEAAGNNPKSRKRRDHFSKDSSDSSPPGNERGCRATFR